MWSAYSTPSFILYYFYFINAFPLFRLRLRLQKGPSRRRSTRSSFLRSSCSSAPQVTSSTTSRLGVSSTNQPNKTLSFLFRWLSMLLSYLHCSRSVILCLSRSLKCRSFPEAEGGEESYLFKDYSIDCNSPRYKVVGAPSPAVSL